MRAVLVVAVGITWLWCLIGAITLPVYLMVTAIRALVRRAGHGGLTPSPLPGWSAFVATATAIVLGRRIHAAPTVRPEPQMASVSLQR